MFKFENHMPDYWLNESRDFLLLTRLLDVIFMGLRADIFTIQNLNDSKKCKNTFLPLLAKKVGFFTDKLIDDNVLRNIISTFRLAVKHKGTKLGIRYATTAVLKAENCINDNPVEVIIDNKLDFTVNIYTPVELKNKEALREFLRYIIPAGFIVNIYSYGSLLNDNKTVINNIDRIIAASMNIKTLSATKAINLSKLPKNPSSPASSDLISYMTDRYAGSLNTSIIASIDDIKNASAGALKAQLQISNDSLENGIIIKGK